MYAEDIMRQTLEINQHVITVSGRKFNPRYADNTTLPTLSDDLQPLSGESEKRSSVIPDEYIILPETVLAELERIKIYKAPGPDKLPNWLLRDYAPWLCEPLCAIFNASGCKDQ